jgi:hypothetical protein
VRLQDHGSGGYVEFEVDDVVGEIQRTDGGMTDAGGSRGAVNCSQTKKTK